MTTEIRFVAPVDESFGPARELLCSVWPIAGTEGQPSIGEPVVSNASVLVGASTAHFAEATVELPAAGDYLVDLGLPNGTSVRRMISVTEGEQYRMVMPSQRLPKIDVSANVSRALFVPRVISAALKSVHLQDAELEVKKISQPLAVSLQGLRAFAAGAATQAHDVEILHAAEDAGLSHSLALPDRPVDSFGKGYLRQWLLVAAGTRYPTLIPYPVGWIESEFHAFTLAIHRKALEGGEAAKWSVELELMNPVYGSLIEHLTRRDLVSGENVSRSQRGEATQMLYEKEGNPFAAAVGAYLLALGQRNLDNQVQWMTNLTKRFEWLPDGPIAAGWYRLRIARSGTAEWQDARSLMLLACTRGLPYFTIGLHVLVEGMTLLNMADPEDVEVRGALAAVRAADVACVRNRPFTTLQVSRFLGLPVA